MSEQDAKRHYTGERGRAYHEFKRSIPAKVTPWVARLRAEKITPYVRENDAVFEFGVGLGWNLSELSCRRKIGCDVSTFLEPQVRARGIEFVEGPQLIGNDSIDVVVCHHTLEHVVNPPEVLLELRRILSPEGKLLLFVPFEKERKYRRFDAGEPNHHLYSWNVQSLGNLVAECGFEVLEAGVGEFGYDRFAALNAHKCGIGEGGFRFLRKAIHLVKPMREVRIVTKKILLARHAHGTLDFQPAQWQK